MGSYWDWIQDYRSDLVFNSYQHLSYVVQSLLIALVLGLLVAMLLLELVRMFVDLTTWGMSRRAYLAYRAIVVASLVAAGIAVWMTIARSNLLAGQVELGDGVLVLAAERDGLRVTLLRHVRVTLRDQRRTGCDPAASGVGGRAKEVR